MLFCGVLAAAPVAAHHGAGVFEPDKKITVQGTVTEFQFVNPHVLVYMTVKGENGKHLQWGGELTSPNRLARDERDLEAGRHRGQRIQIGFQVHHRSSPGRRRHKAASHDHQRAYDPVAKNKRNHSLNNLRALPEKIFCSAPADSFKLRRLSLMSRGSTHG